jgi:hypothetical protein
MHDAAANSGGQHRITTNGQPRADADLTEDLRRELARYDRAGGQMLMAVAGELARVSLHPLVTSPDPKKLLASDESALNKLKVAAGSFAFAVAALAPSAAEDVRAELLERATLASPLLTLYARLVRAWETADHDALTRILETEGRQLLGRVERALGPGAQQLLRDAELEAVAAAEASAPIAAKIAADPRLLGQVEPSAVRQPMNYRVAAELAIDQARIRERYCTPMLYPHDQRPSMVFNERPPEEASVAFSAGGNASAELSLRFV